MYKRWQDWAIAILGLWLALSPFVIRYGDAAAMVAHVLGTLVFLMALVALYNARRWPERINILWAILIILAPFFVFTPEDGAWNQLLIGLFIFILCRSALKTVMDPALT
jgi:hypothetical protein